MDGEEFAENEDPSSHLNVGEVNQRIPSGNGIRSNVTEAGMTDPTLFKKLQDPHYQSDYGVSLMHVAVLTRNPNEFQQVLAEHPDYLNVIDNVERTPIYFAILLGRMKIFKMLVDAGAMLNVADLDGCTPAHWAAYNGSSDMLQVLISKAIDLNAVDNQGRTVLHWATAQKSPKCTEILAKLPRVNVNAEDEEHMTPLHWACFHNNSKHIKSLLAAKANVSARDIEGKTPLHWCSGNKDTSCVKILLAKPEVNVNEQDKEGRTLLHLCIGDDNKEIAALILKSKECNSGIQDNTGRSALHWAVALKRVGLVTLLAKDDNAFVQDLQGATPYHYAAQVTDDDTIKAIIKGDNKGAHIDIVDLDHRTALFWALAHDNIMAAKILLNSGANPNHKDNTGRTILHLMASSREHQVQVLANNRSTDLDLVDDEHGETALMIACDHEQPGIAKVLIDSGAKVDAIDGSSRNAMHVSCISGSLECLTYLTDTKSGLDHLDVQDDRGETPLHYACYYGNADCVSHLLSIGADPNILDKEGISSLHWAASQGYVDITRLLLDYHAHPNFLDHSDDALTPMDYATAGGHDEIVELLANAEGAHAIDLKNYAATKAQSAVRVFLAKKELERRKTDKLEKEKKRIAQMSEEHQKAEEESRKKKEEEEKKKLQQALQRQKEDAARKEKEDAARKEKEDAAKKEKEDADRKKQEAAKRRKAEEDRKKRDAQRRQQEQENEVKQKALEEDEASAILSNRKNRVKLVRSEQSRVYNVRRKMEAARTIQIWWRKWKRVLDNAQQPPAMASSYDKRVPRVYKNIDMNGKKARRGKRQGEFQPKDSYSRKELIAVLTIQLWWRRYLASKHRLTHPRRKKNTRGPQASNAIQSQRIDYVYNSHDNSRRKQANQTTRNTYRSPVAVRQFKAKVHRPVRSNLLPNVPPPITMSWMSAAENYYQPPVPRGTRRTGRTNRGRRDSLPHIQQTSNRNSNSPGNYRQRQEVFLPSI